jgi:hypothetical protein
MMRLLQIEVLEEGAVLVLEMVALVAPALLSSSTP